jgi:hypothetical protein
MSQITENKKDYFMNYTKTNVLGDGGITIDDYLIWK